MEKDPTNSYTGFTLDGGVENVLCAGSRNGTPWLVLLGIATVATTITTIFSFSHCLPSLHFGTLQALHKLEKTAPKTEKQKLFTNTAGAMCWRLRALVLILAHLPSVVDFFIVLILYSLLYPCCLPCVFLVPTTSSREYIPVLSVLKYAYIIKLVLLPALHSPLEE